MWMRFPNGTESCSVEQQHFVPEFKDELGRDWFRVPDHFGPILLGTGLGYGAMPSGQKPLGCTVDDLPPSFPGAAPSADVELFKLEIQRLNEELQKKQTQQNQSESVVRVLQARVRELEEENAILRGRLDTFESEQETNTAVIETKAKTK